MKQIERWFFPCAAATWLSAAGALSGGSFNVPAPASLSVTTAPGGAQITYRGATNFQFLIQTSTNWTGWSLLASNVATNQAITFVDTQAKTMPARFYKAVSLKTPFIYQGAFIGTPRGNFLLFARTNNLAAFIGFTISPRRGEFTSALAVSADGNACGTFITGAPGCLLLTDSNTVSGKITNAMSQTATITGGQKANTGAWNGAAGLYSGTIVGSYPGSAKLLLCLDGTFAFYRTGSPGGQPEGQITSLTPNGNNAIVDFSLATGYYPHVTGAFTRASRTFSLTLHELDLSPSTVSMTLSEPLF